MQIGHRKLVVDRQWRRKRIYTDIRLLFHEPPLPEKFPRLFSDLFQEPNRYLSDRGYEFIIAAQSNR